MYHRFIKMLLTVLISTCLVQVIVATAQSRNNPPTETASARLTRPGAESPASPQSLSVSLFSPMEAEPLLLLLLGLAVFLGATTLKKKKSGVRSDGDV